MLLGARKDLWPGNFADLALYLITQRGQKQVGSIRAQEIVPLVLSRVSFKARRREKQSFSRSFKCSKCSGHHGRVSEQEDIIK